MGTLESKPLCTPCYFRADGVFCDEGYLAYSSPEYTVGVGEHMRQARVMVEGEPVTCSACEGKGHILTNEGRQIITLIQTFGRPFLRDLVDELFEEREQH